MNSVKKLAKKVVGADKIPEVNVVSTQDVLQGAACDPVQGFLFYLKSLFPITNWITHYNLGWLTGDVIAGLTVGMVLIPQAMAYAKIATLSPEYGLYSSFVGVMTYCFFATSKDVSIGPVTVLSLITAEAIKDAQAAYPDAGFTGPQIGTVMAFICGFIVLAIGLLRLGWVVDFISYPAVAGFVTGSALTIVTGQIPSLFGIQSRFNTRESLYKVLINVFKNLKYSTRDTAFGIMGLAALYAIQIGSERLARQHPSRARWFFYMSTLRNAFVIIILTLSAYLYAHPRKDGKDNYPINILKTVPRGFKHVGSPYVTKELVKATSSHIPVATIVMLLEHIATGRAFGRINNYVINPNQELIAMGVTNVIGSVFNAYPATGCFSRTAVKSKSGVRTPAAGVITGVTVIVALYALTDAFFWIPNAGLAAVVIHAVSDLVTPPSQVYAFWRVNPLECLIWWAAVLVTVFSTIENGIYTSIIASIVILVVRIARPRGSVLGRVAVHGKDEKQSREIYVPMERTGSSREALVHPHLVVDPPLPGVIIFRPEESVLYPNAVLLTSGLFEYIKQNTRTGRDTSGIPLRDRPWNDPGPRRGAQAISPEDEKRPLLRSIVFDLSTVSHMDTTAIQALMDTRQLAERWSDRTVTFHFCHILSPWIRRALLTGGFGLAVDEKEGARIPGDIGPINPPTPIAQRIDQYGYTYQGTISRSFAKDLEGGGEKEDVQIEDNARERRNSQTNFEGSVVSTSTPYFHYDLATAVQAAERDAMGGSFAEAGRNSIEKEVEADDNVVWRE